jgi:hypothetical protein
MQWLSWGSRFLVPWHLDWCRTIFCNNNDAYVKPVDRRWISVEVSGYNVTQHSKTPILLACRCFGFHCPQTISSLYLNLYVNDVTEVLREKMYYFGTSPVSAFPTIAVYVLEATMVNAS